MRVEDYIAVENLDNINDIINDFDMTDNNERADTIKDLLENDFNSTLKECGCGTNRIVFKDSDNPDIVIKVALDDRGIKDNNLEYSLAPMINRDFPDTVPPCYVNNGLVSISKRIKVMNSYTMKENKEEVRKILEKLASKYILNDVGFKEFLNWGIDKETGKLQILDYAYLKPITIGMDFTCPYKDPNTGDVCGGRLAYTKNFKSFKCIECGSKVSLSAIQDPLRVLSDSYGAVFSDSILNK